MFLTRKLKFPNVRFFNDFAIVLAGVLLLVATVTGQRLIQGTKPLEREVKGFDRGFCSHLSDGFRVCKAVISESGQTKYVIQRSGTTFNSIEAPYWSYAMTDPDAFYAFRGDLDNDGSHEIVIASLEGRGNGIGIEGYNIHIFQDPLNYPFRQPLTFPLEEFGVKGSFIFDTKSNQTNILVTFWKDFANLDSKRIPGLYLVGKWFIYDAGQLKPLLHKPTLARRFLYSFADERNQTYDKPTKPYMWLKSRNTHRFLSEPEELSNLVSTQFGIVRGYEEDKETYSQFLRIATNNGEVKAIYSYSNSAENKGDNTACMTSVGVSRGKYIYPLYFRPDIYPSSIEGKRVRMDTYEDDYGHRYTKLWFLD